MQTNIKGYSNVAVLLCHIVRPTQVLSWNTGMTDPAK